MDAPPGREDCTSFIRIAGILEAMQLNAPRIIEADQRDGFLLITDLGETQYLESLLADGSSAPSLYGDAMNALLLMQGRGTAYQSSLPPYDDELLRFELSLFHDWLCEKHLGIQFSRDDESNWEALCNVLVSNALDQPQVFVHRDFHSRNLMVSGQNNPGILDFQDAVEGPLTYDLTSLLKDCYVSWPFDQVEKWACDFHSRLDSSMQQQVDVKQFLRYFQLMGVHRHLKAAGIFARLNHRDDKPDYMADIPRTLSYIVELGPHFVELEFLAKLISKQCLPKLRSA